MIACTPHPGFGTVSARNGSLVRHVDLATCRTWTTKAGRQVVIRTPTIVATRRSQTIVYRGRRVYTVRERHDRIPGGSPGPIELFGTSSDGKWVLFAIDPQNSASLAADGLTLQAVAVNGGRPRVVATGLLADDYRAWCNGELVMTAGGDRIAAHHKWLIVTGPPSWRARRLLVADGWAFGSLACAPKGVVVQATRDLGVDESKVMNPRWSLWRVGFDGTHTVLDTPPKGSSDDSPRVARDGTVVFIRSRRGVGVLWAHGAGALAAVGRDDGYYGHRPWASITWSLRR